MGLNKNQKCVTLLSLGFLGLLYGLLTLPTLFLSCFSSKNI